jgi:DNA helicase II / ATP-dependent DNA helicase PcrA
MNKFAIAAKDAKLICGAQGTGKSTALIETISERIDAGVAASDILVLCASPFAADSFYEQLNSRCSDGADVRVTVARELALEILATPEAVAYTGREARMLQPFEVKILLEDMKTSGMLPKRLKEMMRFFYRSFCDLEDDDPDWLINDEERGAIKYMRSYLSSYRAYLEYEISNFAVNYLRNNAEALASESFDTVILDDVQMQSRASLMLGCMLARNCFRAAGDKRAKLEPFEAYPYADAIEEFEKVLTPKRVITLDQFHNSGEAYSMITNLYNESHLADDVKMELASDALPGSCAVEQFRLAKDELAGIVTEIKTFKDMGVSASDIAIVTGRSVWARTVARNLRKEGIAVSTVHGGGVLRGDTREFDSCVAERIFALLSLVANKDDSTALRAWLAFGDCSGTSDGYTFVRQYIETNDCSLREAIESIDKYVVPEGTSVRYFEEAVDKLGIAYASLNENLEKLNGLTGIKLVEAATRLITKDDEAKAHPVIMSLCQPSSDTTATEMVATALSAMNCPRILLDDEAIKVGTIEELVGANPQVLIYAGFMNGFIPRHEYFDSTVTTNDKQKIIHDDDAARLYIALGQVKKTIVLTYFTRVDLATAGRLALKINRIALENGKKVCKVGESLFMKIIRP